MWHRGAFCAKLQDTPCLTIKAGANAPGEGQSPVAVLSVLRGEDRVAHSAASAAIEGTQLSGARGDLR